MNKKYISWFFIPFCATPFISSCSTKEAVAIDNSYFRYIQNRTFSILGTGNGYDVHATGWILNKKTGGNEYEYWLATNWHAVYYMKKYLCTKFCFGDNSSVAENDYHDFIKFDTEPEANFTWKHQYIPSSPYTSGIDLSIIDVDFGTSANFTEWTFNKLETLNATYDNYHTINQFVENFDKSNDAFFVAGYPLRKKDSTATWSTAIYTKHEILKPSSHEAHGSKGPEHPINLYDSQKSLWDTANQYKLSKQAGQGNLNLDAGASGSLCINEKYEVIGIFWGGITSGWFATNWHPYISIFACSDYSFINTYK